MAGGTPPIAPTLVPIGQRDPDSPAEGPNLGYMPALDGVRGLAVLGVMAFHGGVSWLGGGFLSLDTFFVLSGFLITSLLITEWQSSGAIRLGAFWARRARRLLPALLLVLVFVVAYANWVAPPGTYPGLRLDALSTLFYVANWHFILVGSDYFARSGLPSPLTHTWSLAVEEQFYLVWPLVVLAVLRFGRGLRTLMTVSVVGAVASAVAMALLFRSGASITRLYFGTDTHGQSLLVGAVLAVVLARRTAKPAPAGGPGGPGALPSGNPAWLASGRWAKWWLPLLGAAGAVATALLWWRASFTSGLVWQGGVLVASVSTAAVLCSVVCAPASLLAAALSIRPLRYVGRISYGMYLWHYPLFLWIDGARTGLTGPPLLLLRFGATVAVASASFFLVERPVRQHRLLRQWRAWLVAPAAVGGVAAVLVVATTGPGAAAPGAAPVPVRPPIAPTTSARSPAVPSEGPGGSTAPTTTVLMVGDSTAITLGLALSTHEQPYGASIVNQGMLGCGVAEMSQALTRSTVIAVPPGCNPSAPASSQWPALWAGLIAAHKPQVVAVLAGRWEVSTVDWNGQWTNIGNPAFARYVEQQLRLAVKVASSGGARVALLTAPCYDGGEQPDGDPWPADSPARLATYNRLLAEAAASSGGVASVVNLDALVCPGGSFVTSIDGVTVRAPDGVHFPYYTVTASQSPDPDTVTQVEEFGAWLAPRLWPQILAAGSDHGHV
ncbi:MAG TPA: acyltransferase family protein [Acidimicrobiales bacterium]|nr:acyltransferase family protein [Acidimicrobiales bacterium]